MSECQGCAGRDQKPHERVTYSGRLRRWLCAICRAYAGFSEYELQRQRTLLGKWSEL